MVSTFLPQASTCAKITLGRRNFCEISDRFSCKSGPCRREAMTPMYSGYESKSRSLGSENKATSSSSSSPVGESTGSPRSRLSTSFTRGTIALCKKPEEITRRTSRTSTFISKSGNPKVLLRRSRRVKMKLQRTTYLAVRSRVLN